MAVSYIGEEWEGSADHSLSLTAGHHVLEYLLISPEGGGRMEERERKEGGMEGREKGGRDGGERKRRRDGGRKVENTTHNSLSLQTPPPSLPPSPLLTCTMVGQES